MQSFLFRDSVSRPRFCPQVTELESRLTPTVGFALSNNTLIPFDTSNPNGASTAITITGLSATDNLVGIAVRPQNGFLYGLGYNATAGTVQLYTISTLSGIATPVGTTGTFVNASGTAVRIGVNANTRFGIDFNPAADRLRVVTNEGAVGGGGQNFRINPNSGAFVDGDLGMSTSVNGLNMDGDIKGATTTVQATAYTNHSPNAGTVTTQYTIDDSTSRLYIQNTPNSGTETNPINLTFNGPVTLGNTVGFGIDSNVVAPAANTAVTSGIAYAISNALDASFNQVSVLLQIDLTTGVETLLGTLKGVSGGAKVQGLALEPVQQGTGAVGTPIIGLTRTGTTQQLIRFNSGAPGTATRINIAGVTAGESLVGVSFRPSTGQLFGVGISPTTNTGTLYLIDPQTGIASIAFGGTGGAIAFKTGAGATVAFPDPTVVGYGLDFNPTVDRIRITTSTGLNFRVNPTNGQPVDGDLGGVAGSVPNVNTDANINGGATGVSAIAYTNPFPPAPTTVFTTQYALDPVTDSLFIQNTPNSGTETLPKLITINGSRLAFSDVNGFDIPTSVQVNASNSPVTAGFGLASLTVGGVTSLYSINLVTGAATSLGIIDNGTTAVEGLATAIVPVGGVSLSPATVSTTAGTNVTLTLLRTGGTSGAFTATVTPVAGTADTTDFDPTPQTVSFADGQTSATVTITVKNSGKTAPRSFTVTVSSTTGGAVAGASSTITIGAGSSGGGGGGTNSGSISAVAATGGGTSSTVNVYNANGTIRFVLTPYPGFMGSISVAEGDVNGDGTKDIITGAGPGGGPHVKVFDGVTGKEIRSFFAFEPTFSGGVSVGAVDLTNSGFADIIVGAGPGGGPRVDVFNGLSLGRIYSFYAYDPKFTGGVNVAGGDVNGDGFQDIVTGTMTGNAHVRAFDGQTLNELASFYAFDPSFGTGVTVAVAGGRIVTGPGVGEGGAVRVYTAPTGTFSSFTPFPGFQGEIRVGTNSAGNIVVGAGPGAGPAVKTFKSSSLVELSSFFAFDVFFTGGVFVG